MKKSKTLFFIFFLAITSIKVFSQSDKIVITYDNAGNRIKREFVPDQSKSGLVQEGVTGTEETDAAMQELANSFKLYPNPSSSMATILFYNSNEFQSVTLKIYDLTSRLISEETLYEYKTSVDISGFAHGVYIFELVADDKSVRKKVVRE